MVEACSSDSGDDVPANGSDASVKDGAPQSVQDASTSKDASHDASHDAPADSGHDVEADAGVDATQDAPADSAVDAGVCTTRVTYGRTWIHGAGHPDAFDDAQSNVTWDGTCTDEGSNSFAVLSNGWKPYFTGHSACVIALDHSNCPNAPAECTTRIAYGTAWGAPPNHSARYDDVRDRILWDGTCHTDGSAKYAALSNGWQPHFSGAECQISLEYSECGGLYANPVVPVDCPDPGVLRDGARTVVACTSGNGSNAFPIRVSADLVTWSSAGFIFPAGSKPTWAQSDFWAPEIHRVGAGYVAYFTARHTDGQLSIGAATATSATGPFTDIGSPIAHDSNMGLIDPNEYEAPTGTRYLLWKEDGNAVGKQTPIHIQELAADGRSLVGSPSTVITNDQAWEGGVVEGPWLIDHGGSYYLFYSGNSYANGTYAVGVARASSPLGPYAKAAAPILVTNQTWVGPGHCSVVDAPDGDTYMVYHAWQNGHVNGPGDGRLLLVDRVIWDGNGWPTLPVAPSTVSLPKP